MSNILFSFVGKSDPVMNNWDGPMLHIIRNYDIDKVYLYYSKEMIERDSTNIYENTLKALKESLEVIKIYRDQLDNPHLFGLIDDDLKEIFIKEIKIQNPNATIYANVSSGTPQLISSLYLVAMSLPFPIKLIQVEDPEPRANKDKKNFYDFINKSGTEILNESFDSFEIKNRCIEVRDHNFLKFVINENASSLLDSFNYSEAYWLLNNYKELYSKEIIELVLKLSLKYSGQHEKARKMKSIEDLYPISNNKVSDIYDYLLYLNSKIKLDLISEFARAISPAVTTLLMDALKIYFKVDILNDYIIVNSKNKKNLNVEKIMNDYPNIDFVGDQKSKYINTKNLLKIYKYLVENSNDKQKHQDIIDKFEFLYKFEEDFRNTVAHEIKSLCNEDLKKSIGEDSKGVMKKIKQLFELLYKEYKGFINWNFYDSINKKIKAKLKGVYDESEI